MEIQKSQYKSLQEWAKACPKEYIIATNKWFLTKICNQFGWKLISASGANLPGFWTLKECKKDALKYNKKVEWNKKSPSAYSIARRNGWVEDCCHHMKVLLKPNGHWTLKNCVEDAKKYNTKKEWGKNSSAYSIARKNKWIIDCCSHMPKRAVRLTKEYCMSEAKKYTMKHEWLLKDRSSYAAAHHSGWLEDCSKHMIKGYGNMHSKWTKEKCLKDAKKYKTRNQWDKNSKSAVGSARRNDWHQECCKHMVRLRKASIH